MLYSRFFIPTLREDPADAETVSHRLMTRAGMIRKLAAGIYHYLPLGLRSLRKVEGIVREEMNRAGAVELLMPGVLPADLWRETGRWDQYGKELLRFKDRAGREFCLGPTHEEAITDLVRREVRSYKQLPLNLYQIQTKFRDEIRPRFGVMRAREFIMKDAYSFDADDEGADRSYWAMFEAYTRIFERCGLEFRAVQADTGNIGGTYSHEFVVLAPTGEDVIMSCGACDYAANIEMAEIGSRGSGGAERASEEGRPPAEVHTPGVKTVEEVAQFLGVEESCLIKTLIVETNLGVVAALVRGDHELSLTKLRNRLGADWVELAGAERIEEVTGGPLGFSGPVGLRGIKIVADTAVPSVEGGVTGANKRDLHLVGVRYGRDYAADVVADIRVAAEGDPCPRCSAGRLTSSRGIEVGHVFRLGTKYSEAMGATFVDRDGKEKPFVMGCYGIGIGRTLAASIEQSHDERGIVFPLALAPFEVVVLPLKMQDASVRDAARGIYEALLGRGVEVVMDDRDEGPGSKFKDAELIGIPVQVAVGPKGLERGEVDLNLRDGSLRERVAVEGVVDEVARVLESLRGAAPGGKTTAAGRGEG